MSSTDLPCIGCSSQEGCGTGTGNWPKPGDPDNNSVITSRTRFNGIEVMWTYPATFPYAVAHTILYRSYLPDFEFATQHAIVAGNYYFDQNEGDENQTKYYWIVLVSVNGTYGDPIGPAWSTPYMTTEAMLDMLTGRIDSGVLGQALKSEISRIEVNAINLNTEINDRINANEQLSGALDMVNSELGRAFTYIDSRVDSVVTEQDALISKVDTLTATVNLDISAAIQAEQTARADGDSALAQQITQLSATVEQDVTAAIQEEARVRAEQDGVLAQRITTVQTEFNDDLAQVQIAMETNISNLGDKVTGIGALYTAKVNVNGLIGGFGIYNDGSTVEAGFDVNTFWVGSSQGNKRKPFIIENGITYINEAAINSLLFTKLRSEDGSVVFQNGKLQAQYMQVNNLSALSANMGVLTTGKMRSADGKFVIDMDGKTIRIEV